jgi:hypothetical protein
MPLIFDYNGTLNLFETLTIIALIIIYYPLDYYNYTKKIITGIHEYENENDNEDEDSDELMGNPLEYINELIHELILDIDYIAYIKPDELS